MSTRTEPPEEGGGAASASTGPDWLPGLLQTTDPLFPTGGYAHSLGLEPWAEATGMAGPEGFAEFLHGLVGPSLARAELPYLRALCGAVADGDWATVATLDEEVHAWKWSGELRGASLAQGRGRLRLLDQMWPEAEVLRDYHRAAGEGVLRGHHLTVSALQAVLLAVPVGAALSAYAYQTLANHASAAVKILRISAEGAQRVLRGALERLGEWLEEARGLPVAEAGWFAPALDIASARHATAFARLFLS
jgi:urease accessory protein